MSDVEIVVTPEQDSNAITPNITDTSQISSTVMDDIEEKAEEVAEDIVNNEIGELKNWITSENSRILDRLSQLETRMNQTQVIASEAEQIAVAAAEVATDIQSSVQNPESDVVLLQETQTNEMTETQDQREKRKHRGILG